MRRRQVFLLSGAVLLLGAVLGVRAASPAVGAGDVHAIEIRAQQVPLNPSDRGQDRVGRLQFLGALVLESSDKRFGGISGILWDRQCSRLLGISDAGSWIVLQPVEEGDRLVDMKTGWIAPILDVEGHEPASKSDADAEELAQTADGDVLVFYEQRHRAARFQGISACAPETLGRKPVAELVFPQTAGWPSNGGMEAATARGQSLLILSESVPAKDGGRQGFEVRQGEPAIPFTWVPPADHEPTAMDLFPDSHGRDHVLVLHRRFSPFTGVSAVIAGAEVGKPPAARIEGRTIARLAPPLTVDNMEGLAVRQEAGGLFVYLVSDNNFNGLQRTILMKFCLIPDS